MLRKDKIYTLQRMGYTAEMISGELGIGVVGVMYRMHTPKDYSERNRVRKMYSGGKSTIEIHRATGLEYGIIANHLRTPKKIVERRDVGSGVKDYFYSFRHLKKYLPRLTLQKYNDIKNKNIIHEGYTIKEIKPEIINYDFAD